MPKLHLFLCLFISASISIITIEAIITESKYHCSNSTVSSSPNSTFKANLDLLLKSLLSNSTARSGYYYTSVGRSADAVYGSFLCKGDLAANQCEECVANATKTIVLRCPESDSSILWYDQCMVRYSNHSFFSIMETEPMLYGYNEENVVEPDRFMLLLNKTTGHLKDKLSPNNSKFVQKYAVKQAKFSASETLYTMAQCTPDLNVADCRKCLEIAILDLRSLRRGKIGGRVLLPSCFVRFELYAFYKSEGGGKRRLSPKVIAGVTASAAVVLAIFCLGVCFVLQRKAKERKDHLKEDQGGEINSEISELHALQFPLSVVLAATNNFGDDSKLGEGGFGPVYKGKLPAGEEIAAKRLSRGSGQGMEEFKNEVELVAKLQHRNLVRLLGFSFEREERVLVYEFVRNGSLDYSLFDPQTGSSLDWPTRYKIMLGIARGLLYLHEDSRLKIIHRDLKASNILLDADMNPKISDFGMARIFCSDQTLASTNRIVGTYGYMSPEYMMFGHFSVKSDVFSFGVLVLEIITGKKNSKFNTLGSEEGLLGLVWKHWSEGTPSEVVDPSLTKVFSVNEAIRCIHIGLLCVQDDMEDRPSMDAVVLMLNSDSISLPLPHQPSFFFPSRRNKQPPSELNLDSGTQTLTLLSADEGLQTDPGAR